MKLFGRFQMSGAAVSEASFSNPTVSFIAYQDAKPNGGRAVTRTRRGDSYMDDPRSELESMLSSSIDAELPFALERKYVPHQGLGSDARANVSVYIFALACFHLVFQVLVGGWGVSVLVIRSDLVRSGQIRSGQTRSDQGR